RCGARDRSPGLPRLDSTTDRNESRYPRPSDLIPPHPLEADEENGNGAVLKLFHHRASVSSRTVEVTIFNIVGGKLLFQQRQHFYKLAKDEHTMSTIDSFFQQLAKYLQFAGGRGGVGVL